MGSGISGWKRPTRSGEGECEGTLRFARAFRAGASAYPTLSCRILGMSTQEVADTLVALCSEGKFLEAIEALYSPELVSMEAGAPPGGSRESKGIAAVRAKGQWWAENHEVHGLTVEGPLVAGSHFSVAFKMDVTFKPQGKRFQMEEIAVYKVADGKVVYEEFFYAM